MLLNPYNCFQIDGSGIYVYFPELNRLFFYEEKKGKDFYFNPYHKKIKSEDNEILYEGNVGQKKNV